MIDLTDVDDVLTLQQNMRAALEGPAGKEVLAFLNQLCGWYDFTETQPDMILINHGKRQVLATIKTLLNCSAEQVAQIAEGDEGNAFG